jgi:hypothetical protein
VIALPVLKEQRWNLIASGLAPQLFAFAALRGHGAGDERDPEFGEALAQATGVRAPLGLIELVYIAWLPMSPQLDSAA